MYMAGVDMSIMNLYPKVTFPVSRGTPFLSNLPHWHEHNFDAMQALAPFANKVILKPKTNGDFHLVSFDYYFRIIFFS